MTTPHKPHKHADILRAIANGAAFEYRHHDIGLETPWLKLLHLGTLEHTDVEFRRDRQPHKWQREDEAQKAGKAVQYQTEYSEVWQDGPAWGFNGDGKYRVKPDMVRFRVAAFRFDEDSLLTLSANSAEEEQRFANGAGFVEWLGDWQEVELSA